MIIILIFKRLLCSSLGQFGAVFLPGGVSAQPQDMVLFAARPSYRLWKANCDGSVQSTCIFKDLIVKSTEGLNLLEDTIDINDIRPNKPDDAQFGPLYMYQVCICSGNNIVPKLIFFIQGYKLVIISLLIVL